MDGRAEGRGNQPTQLPDSRDKSAENGPDVNSKAFKRWFGKSKVVDENGDPRISYSIDLDSIGDSEQMETTRDRTPEEKALAQALAEFRNADEREKKALRKKLPQLQTKAVESRKRQRLQASATKKIDAEIRKRILSIRRMVEERKSVEAAVKQLEELVKQLPGPVQGQFRGFGALASRKTDAGKKRFIEQATSRIETILDKYQRKNNRGALFKLLGKFYTDYGPDRRKRQQAVGDVAFKELYFAAHLMRDSEAPAPKSLHPDRIEYLRNVFSGVGLAEASAARIADALRAAGEIAKGGRSGMDRFNEKRIRFNDERNRQAVETILQGKEAKDEQILENEKTQQNRWVRIGRSAQALFFDPLNGLQQFLNILDGKKGGPLEAHFNNAAIAADQDRATRVREHVDQTTEEVAAIWGDAKRQHAWFSNADQETNIGVSWNSEKGVKPQSITKMQGIDILLKWGDKSLEGTFEEMAIDETTIKVIRQFVGKEGVKLAEYLRQRYGDVGLQIQHVFKQTEGFAMDLVEGYGGRVYRAGVSVDKGDTMFALGGNNPRPTVKSASMKERVGSVKPIVFKDAVNEFQRHMGESLHYISHAQLSKDLFATFRNKDVTNAIRQEHGGKMLNSLQELVDDIITGGPKYHGEIDKFLNTLRANITKASLGIKPSILIKQLTSSPAFIEEIGFKPYGDAWLKFASNPGKWIKTLSETEYVKNRMSGSMYADLQQELDGRSHMLKESKISDWLMLNVKYGDISAVIMGGAPVYIHTYNEAIRNGKSPEQARVKAEKVFAASSERAQQASAVHSRGSFLRGNAIMRAFFMYLTSPMQYQRNVNVALYNYARNRNKETRNQLIRAGVIYHVVLPQIFQAVASGMTGFTSDDDEVLETFWARQRRALMLGNLNAIPAVGQIASGFANWASGANETFQSSGSPLIDLGNDLVRDSVRMMQGKDGGLQSTVENISKLGGIPLETVLSNAEAFQDVSEGETDHPIMRLLGWSGWSLGE